MGEALRWLLAAVLLAAAQAQAQPILVFAAASLRNALDEANAHAPAKALVSYAASSALARQIESGAPAQLFISADAEWMDYLERRALIQAGTRRNLLGNRLVLVAPVRNPMQATIKAGFPLPLLLGPSGRLAVGDPGHVPAGRYAKAALETLGVWKAVAGRLAPAENVRAALALVARGEAPLGVVYATDAAAEPGVRIVDVFPEGSHPPIVYPAALTAIAQAHAAGYLAFLRSNAARAIFEKHGFTPLN
jgi:molybdate transport system substrate-binding protein